MIAILAGAFAFAVAFAFDWASVRKAPRAKPALLLLFVALQGYALFAALWRAQHFALPAALSILGWVMLPIFSFLLVYSLAIELPAGATYSGTGSPNRLVTTGTYALARHPGVIWYVLALVSLVLATRSTVLAIAAPVWSVMNIAYATVEDRYFFTKIFPEYKQYKQQTPMFIPTIRSLAACIRTLRRKPQNRVGSKRG